MCLRREFPTRTGPDKGRDLFHVKRVPFSVPSGRLPERRRDSKRRNVPKWTHVPYFIAPPAGVICASTPVYCERQPSTWALRVRPLPSFGVSRRGPGTRRFVSRETMIPRGNPGAAQTIRHMPSSFEAETPTLQAGVGGVTAVQQQSHPPQYLRRCRRPRPWVAWWSPHGKFSQSMAWTPEERAGFTWNYPSRENGQKSRNPRRGRDV